MEDNSWKCPVCGSTEVVTDDDFPEISDDMSTITFPCNCNECGAQFTIVCDLKYRKTINVVKGDE
jgi:transcriptional regulator NrdR family protein